MVAVSAPLVPIPPTAISRCIGVAALVRIWLLTTALTLRVACLWHIVHWRRHHAVLLHHGHLRCHLRIPRLLHHLDHSFLPVFFFLLLLLQSLLPLFALALLDVVDFISVGKDDGQPAQVKTKWLG